MRPSSLKKKADGFTERRRSSSGAIALKKPFSPNRILVAVVAVKAPCVSKLAFSPNTMPFGFIKTRAALDSPVVPSNPSMFDKSLPVTRPKIV